MNFKKTYKRGKLGSNRYSLGWDTDAIRSASIPSATIPSAPDLEPVRQETDPPLEYLLINILKWLLNTISSFEIIKKRLIRTN